VAHLAEERRDRERASRHHGDVLLAVDRVRDRRRADARAGHELPQRLARLGVESLEPAVDVAMEHEPTGRRRDATEVRQGVGVPPHLLLLDRVPRDDLAKMAAGAPLSELELHAEVERATL